MLMCVVRSEAQESGSEPISRIAFGSCAKQNQPLPILKSVLDADPDLFLMIGDNIYGDSDDMEVLKAKWSQLGAVPEYQRVKAHCPILATWDDHDYGKNDAGNDFHKRRESQQVFLDFYDEPVGTARRTTDGVYDAKIYGPVGKRVQIILLDTRFFRSPLVKHNSPREPGEGDRGPYGGPTPDDATILGEAQWKWFETQLRKPAEVRIVATSIQAIADGHRWEKWGNFPKERDRLFQLIRDTNANGVILISGDRHSSEISVMEKGMPYPLIDVTSSSLNSPAKWHTELNEFRVGTKYTDENFGMVTIDWEEADPTVRAQVRDMAGKVVLQYRIRLSELRP